MHPAPGGTPAELVVFGRVASGAAPEQRDQGNRARDPTIRLFKTYRRLIRAQVPARLDRVVAEIPEKCEGERCMRLKLAVVREGFFDFIDAEELESADRQSEFMVFDNGLLQAPGLQRPARHTRFNAGLIVSISPCRSAT